MDYYLSFTAYMLIKEFQHYYQRMRTNMLDQMKTLTRENNMCVLATDAGGKPYCSLMAYAVDVDCREIYMVTHRNTKKYQNLVKNPAVSLMIDSRMSAPRERVQALTVEGTFSSISEAPKIKQVKALLLEVHPHLSSFVENEEAEILCIRVSAFLLLNGLSESFYAEL